MEKVASGTATGNLFMQNHIYICVDEHDGKDLKGFVSYEYLDKSVPFTDVSNMIDIIEGMLNEVNYPEPSTKFRSFKKNSGLSNLQEGSALDEAGVDVTEMKEKGKKATFVVQVQYRQNSTWQGKVKWVEDNREVMFRSALELIKLIDEATQNIQ